MYEIGVVYRNIPRTDSKIAVELGVSVGDTLPPASAANRQSLRCVE